MKGLFTCTKCNDNFGIRHYNPPGIYTEKKKKIAWAFLLSTALFFMGIALFFTLIGLVPQFKIEGPETFYRFETAAATARYVCVFTGLLFFLKDRKNGWPILLVSSFFFLNDYINTILIKYNFIQPLMEFVGSFNQVITFLGTFIVLLTLLTFTVIPNKRYVVIPSPNSKQ